LCDSYAKPIHSAIADGSLPQFDLIFGPAYKGIPLCVGVAMSLNRLYNTNYSFLYNRKETKSHSDGGILVGDRACLMGDGCRVLVVDDVMTAGTAVGDGIDLLRKQTETCDTKSYHKVVGVVIAFDRQERASLDNPRSAVQTVEDEHALKVISVAKLSDMIEFVTANNNEKLLERMEAYRKLYGVQQQW